MIIVETDINKLYGIESKTPCRLTGYIHENAKEIDLGRKRRALIICPGGAYVITSEREADPVAFEYYAKDYNVFILRYNCFPKKYPIQLIELAASVDYVKSKAAELGIMEDKIFCMGFSAGGHLVGCLANAESIPFGTNLNFRPNGVVLCYPVISSRTSYKQSHQILTGKINYNSDDYEPLDLETSVTENNPPAFIWATATDNLVPAENSLLYALALAKKGIKYELHIFREGAHGLSLADERTSSDMNFVVKSCQVWVDMADEFLKSI